MVANTLEKRDNSALYRTVWRWHFYAGLFCIPFVVLLSITGAVYLFKPQYTAWQEGAYRNLELSGSRATANQHIAAALAAFPQAKFRSYQLPESPNDAVVIDVISQGERFTAYVQPHSNEVLGSRRFNSGLMQFVKRVHGSLLVGVAGSILVELAASWAIVLILSGVYLWWPRNAKGLAGVLYPRFSGGTRQVWRDVHAVVGFWVSVFVLFLLVSGLPWTQVWGQAFKSTRGWLSSVQASGWESDARAQRQSWRADVVTNYDLNARVLATAHGLGFAAPSELSVSDETTNEWKLSSQTQNRPQRADAWIQSGTGAIIEQRHFADKPLTDKVIGVGIAAHEGHLFGWLNQLLGVVIALALVLLCVSGVVMWRKRRPAPGSLGAPPLPNGRNVKVVLVLTLTLAAVLPVLFASLLALLMFERAVLPRIPAVADWLGTSVRGR